MTQAINTIGGSLLQEEALARGVLMRRFGAWCIDMVLIGILTFTLWLAIAAFGVVTLGLGFSLLPVLASASPCFRFWPRCRSPITGCSCPV